MSPDNEQRLSRALEDLVSTPPFDPDVDLIEQRGRALKRRATARVAIGAGIAGIAAVAVVVAVGALEAPSRSTTTAGGHPAATSTAAPVGTPLIKLADYIKANPDDRTGDATLIRRNQTTSDGKHINVIDLYGDNGTYYFARTLRGLPAEVKAGHSQGDGVFQREVQAAVDAATGDVATARIQMALAPDPSGSLPSTDSAAAKAQRAQGITTLDNWIWENSMDALIAGAGKPQVREGVLRILATLPGVTVTNTTTDRQPTLTLSASAPEVFSGYQEQLTINATTGIPVSFGGGATGHTPDTTITYGVTRVSLADVAAGKV